MAAEVITHSLAVHSLNLGGGGGGGGGGGDEERGEESAELLPASSSKVVHVYARVHSHNSQGIGCPLFVRFISNQP